jgi:hypothetical protein
VGDVSAELVELVEELGEGDLDVLGVSERRVSTLA